MGDDELKTPGLDTHFFRLVATFEAAAMQQLGKIAHPITGDVEVDLDGARDSIDMLDMLKRKSEGNLNKDEERLLEHVLYQLRMNYLETSREQGSEKDAPEAPAGSDGAEETGGAEATGGADATGAADAPDAADETGSEGGA